MLGFIEQVNEDCEAVEILSKRGHAVLISASKSPNSCRGFPLVAGASEREEIDRVAGGAGGGTRS